jgi:hypothetical protein
VFDEEFRQLNSPEDCLIWAKKHWTFIAKGTARSVFSISEDKIIKITNTKRENHIDQNKNEWNISSTCEPNHVAKVYEKHPSFIWIVSEKIKPFKNEGCFHSATGIDYCNFYAFIQSKRKPFVLTGNRGILVPDEKHSEGHYHKSMYLSREKHVALFEMAHTMRDGGPKHWGLNSEGHTVMIDCGITWNYLNKYTKNRIPGI